MRAMLRPNGLSLFFAALFLATLVAQSFAGMRSLGADHREHGDEPPSWRDYVTSADYWGAVMENWQSEFLQFTVFVAATVWLVQKGSNESKTLDRIGRESDEVQKLGEHTTARSPVWRRLASPMRD